MIQTIFIGKTPSLPPAMWLPELEAAGVAMLIDLTGDRDNFSSSLIPQLTEKGMDYIDFSPIPDGELVRDEFFEELFNPEEQLLFQVPVRFDQFCLHELPLAIYNSALRYPEGAVALLVEHWELQDKLRIHFALNVARRDIKEIAVSHLFPAISRSSGQLIFEQFPNEVLEPYAQQFYEQVIDKNVFAAQIAARSDLRPFTIADLQPARPAVISPAPDTKPVPKHFFLLAYVPRNRGGNELSEEILRFKAGHPVYVDKYIPVLIETLQKRNLRIDCVIRALGSDELTAGGGRPLDIVGQTIMQQLGCPYRPELIHKKHRTTPLKQLKTAAARDLEMQDVYEAVTGDVDYNGKNILLLDDIHTRGTTFKAIERALHKKWPQTCVYGHFLAQTTW